VGRRRKLSSLRRPGGGNNDESLIRAIGIRLVAEWIKDLIAFWFRNHNHFL